MFFGGRKKEEHIFWRFMLYVLVGLALIYAYVTFPFPTADFVYNG